MTGRPPRPPLPPPPRYGEAALSDVLPSVLSALGVRGEQAPLALAPARRVVVLLVDGLGWQLLCEHPQEAPFLTSLLPSATTLTTGFPSTTATSLTSLGTGLPPGRHGVVGFEMVLPELGRRLNALHWDPAVAPTVVQPHPTAFERARRAGVAVARVNPRAFAGTGLTEASSGGAAQRGADSLGELVAAAAAAVREGERSLVYVYHGDLDSTGHRAGCASDAWRYQLAHIDRLAQQLASVLPPEATLLVTADHGMVDVPEQGRIDLRDRPDLTAGVREVAGEPRALYLYVEPAAREDVVAVWCRELQDDAWVLSRDEAEAAGWFGPQVDDVVRARIGDVVVAARGPVAVLDSRWMPAQLLGLLGMHGSLTDAERLVPLLVHPAGPGPGPPPAATSGEAQPEPAFGRLGGVPAPSVSSIERLPGSWPSSCSSAERWTAASPRLPCRWSTTMPNGAGWA